MRGSQSPDATASNAMQKLEALRKLGGTPLTTGLPDEVIVDRYAIPVAADAAPGRHAIEVGMYDPANIQRLPVLDPSGTVGDRILLADVQVTETKK